MLSSIKNTRNGAFCFICKNVSFPVGFLETICRGRFMDSSIMKIIESYSVSTSTTGINGNYPDLHIEISS
jgi:hypothetical protein